MAVAAPNSLANVESPLEPCEAKSSASLVLLERLIDGLIVSPLYSVLMGIVYSMPMSQSRSPLGRITTPGPPKPPVPIKHFVEFHMMRLPPLV